MTNSPPVALIVGASREADLLRGMLCDHGWPVAGVSDPGNADAVIVAPHPFDSELTEHGLNIARACALPSIVLLRPGWVKQSSDDWHRVPDAAGAAETIRRRGWRRILLAVGQERQAAFDCLADCKLYIRRQGALSRSEGRHEILGASGPFTVNGERRLFRKLQIEAVAAHDAGGAGGWPKIEAARHAGLPVVLIDRPEPPDAGIVETPAQAFSWLASL